MSIKSNLIGPAITFSARLGAYIAYQDGRARDARVPVEERMEYARRVKRCKEFQKAVSAFLRDLGQSEA